MNCTDCGDKLYASHSPIHRGGRQDAVLLVLECYECLNTKHVQVPLEAFEESYRLYDTHYELAASCRSLAGRALGEGERVT